MVAKLMYIIVLLIASDKWKIMKIFDGNIVRCHDIVFPMIDDWSHACLSVGIDGGNCCFNEGNWTVHEVNVWITAQT